MYLGEHIDDMCYFWRENLCYHQFLKNNDSKWSQSHSNPKKKRGAKASKAPEERGKFQD